MNLTFEDLIVAVVAIIMALILDKVKKDKRSEKAKPAEKILTAVVCAAILLVVINFMKPYLM